MICVKIHPDKHGPWLAGFLLTVNIYLVPILTSSPRATDLGGFFLAGWIIFRLVRSRQDSVPLVAVGWTALTPLIWLFFTILNGDSATGVLAARWLLALPWALALVLLVDDEEKQIQFAWGLVVGGLINTLVIILQWQGMESYLQLLGLSSAGANYHTYVSFKVRIPGLHGQHNASSSVISLLIPAIFCLYFKGRCKLSHLLLALSGMMISLHLTSTRSPLIAAVLTVGFASLLARRFGRSVLIGFILVSLLVPLVAVYGPPGGWARWKNTEALVSNASERSDSTLGAARLAVEHPLGLGVKQGEKMLSGRTGIGATHNAFIQAALVFGLPLALLILWGFMVVIFRSLGGVDHPFFLPGLIAFQTAGLFMFEEHLNNPTFIIISAWLIALASLHQFRTGKSPGGSPSGSPR